MSALLAACAPAGPLVSTALSVSSVPLTVMPAGGSQPAPPTQAPMTPIPTLPTGLSPTALKYRLLDQYPGFFYCDPDLYPIARADETAAARENFPALQANVEDFRSILKHNGLSDGGNFTDAQKLLIYRDHKKLAAIVLALVGDQYEFQLRESDAAGQGIAIDGIIDSQGRITERSKVPTRLTCPICLSAATRIATPRGEVLVPELKVGDIVWTTDLAGKRLPAPIVEVARVQVPATHVMVHLVLSDGRELWASPGHPTTDGRRLGDLRLEARLDGAIITGIQTVPYGESATYDLLPGGPTGYYWADGILLASTLSQR
jgi:hypothetical protein